MGCCASTPSSSSPSVHASPYNNDPNAALAPAAARVIAHHRSANGSATAGLTAHAAPGPASSRPSVMASSGGGGGSPRVTAGGGDGTATAAAAAASPGPNDVPNRPLRLPPAGASIPLPLALLSRQQRASFAPPPLPSSPAQGNNNTQGASDNIPASAPTSPTSPSAAASTTSASGTTAMPRITRAALERERAAFFDTRWSGRGEVWAAVRLLCESLRARDAAGAQAVLDAAGLTCASGEVWAFGADGGDAAANDRRGSWRRSGQQQQHQQQQQQQQNPQQRVAAREREGGVYDERGERYQVPLWVVADPEGVVEDGDSGALAVVPPIGGGGGGEQVLARDDGYSDEDDDDIMLSKEKGKGREVDVGKVVKIRARLSDRGTDVVVRVGMEENVVVLRRRVKEGAELPPRCRVKFAYLGKLLDPSISLAAQGYREGHVINALVFHPP